MALRVGELVAYLRANDSDFTNTMGRAGNTMSSVGDKMTGIGKKLTTAVTLPLLGIGAAAVKFSVDFDTSARKVTTIMDGNVMSFEKMKKQSLSLSTQMGVDANEINESLYQVISATGDTVNAFGMVELAIKAAKGGFTDTTTAVDGLTSVMNAYAVTGVDAMQQVSDEMLVAQNLGKTTFGEMASSIGKVAPIAKALNVTTKELFTSIAVLTKNGIGTSEAITALKGAYSNILKPSAEATKLAESLGLEFNAATLSSMGWAKFLQEVATKTGGNTEQMAKLFGSVEALNGMLVLTSETGSKDFVDILDEMGNAGGATQEAFETMDAGLETSFDKMKIGIKNLGISLADELAPELQGIIDKASALISEFGDLEPKQKEQVLKWGAIAIAAGPIALLLGGIATAAGKVTTAAGLLATPLGLVAVAFAGLAVVSKNWFDSLEEGDKQQVINVLTGKVQTLRRELEGVRDIFNELTNGKPAFNAPTTEEKYKALTTPEMMDEFYSSDFYKNILIEKGHLDPNQPINISITGNSFSDIIDIDEVGDRLIKRLQRAGVIK